ncbi:hypothetical protein V493_00711 [Pseudogymnoascus sp. VKM F-4281 (FW-2241)]|nr:hypothetical protein V493_00711 [Pseudogymnoascus sp. VKM F-4281 (FW-2241)]
MSSHAANALEMAQEVAEMLAVIASSLSLKLAKNSESAHHDKVAVNLSTLSTQLHSVHSRLSRPDTAVSQSPRLTKKFLDHLEVACTCHINGKPAPDRRCPYPTLTTALAALRLKDGELVSTTDTTEARRRAKKTQDGLQNGLKKYASATPNIRKPLKDMVDKLLRANSGGTTSTEALKGTGITKHKPREQLYDPPEGIVQRLYKALYDHSRYCNCDVTTGLNCSTRYHAARLSVRPETVVPNRGLTQFDISFSRTLEPFEGKSESYWQHLRLYVPNLTVSNTPKKSTKRGTKPVLRWEDTATEASLSSSPLNSRAVAATATVDASHSTNPSTGGSAKRQATLLEGSETVLEAKGFCELLQRDLDEVRLCFRLEDEAFIELDDAVVVEPRIGSTTSISLAQVLKTERLSTKIRLMLAYSVSRSIWLYYNSDWMNKPWTSDSIHFMPEGNSNSEESLCLSMPNTSNPCFALQFDSSGDSCPETHKVRATAHKYPRVRVLGNLLLELGRGHYTRGAATPNQPDPSVPYSVAKAINRECAQAYNTIDDRNWPDFDIRDKDQVNIYKEAVKSCFEILKMFNEQALCDTLLNSEKRDKEIVGTRPIDELPIHVQIKLRREFIYQKVVAPLEKLLQNAEIVKSTVKANTAAAPSAITDTIDVKQGLTSSEMESKKWLNDILTSTAFRSISEKSGSRSPIKIAVLDTGYDSESIFFQDRSRRCRLKSGNWLDCLDVSKKPVDTDGHGSYVVSLAMKLAPAADIYVARVAENTASLEASSENIARAIHWATDKCAADIVTMSFGFPQERLVGDRPVISSAILKAVHDRDKRILLFGAASNSGANGPEQFPATDAHVISIRATHPNGTPWERNPPVGNHGKAFGTLGTEVPAAWLKSDPQGKIMTGTSAATPIAAGIAAMLLGYTDANDELDDKTLGKLKTQEGMVALFEHISVDSGGLRYIYPLRFLGDSVKDKLRRSMIDLATGDRG